MVKFTIGLGIIALIAGIGNIIVGMGSARELYTLLNLSSAILQIVLSLVVVVTGFARIEVIFKSEFLSKAYTIASIFFYSYIVVGFIAIQFFW